MRGFAQYPLGPLVQAGSFGLGGGQRGAVDFRRDTQHESATGRGLWFLSALPAGVEVVINSLMERHAQIGNGVSVKADDVRDAEDSADEDAVSVVIKVRNVLLKVNLAYIESASHDDR